MDSKARSKSMRNILSKLIEEQNLEVIIFGDHVILEEPIEQWPRCDILMAFFSDGFPLQKAIEYADLTHPYLINDLLMQELLLDRRVVLAILDAIDVPTIKRIIVNRDRPALSTRALGLASRNFGLDFGMVFKHKIPYARGESMELNGISLKRPFVEKPANAEDHNINIYFPEGEGGRKLFRKVENKSSEADPNLTDLRTESSYIYEEFVQMDNSEDVKVYTVGPYHAYAETRR